ncbi:MAG TPA: Mur ligase family protein, partial [Isosphaeraceae bacterium]|nr:Mur ligase family protein [Isosphaeraceae bacterium]
MLSDYQERLDYLYSRLNYEWLGMPKVPGELRLGRMRRVLRRLGDPHARLRVIHIAGTKGKGSTAAMMAAALTASGVRTGLYCSPHLHRLEERFTIDGRPAAPAELIALVDEVREAIEPLELDDPHLREHRCTFFEMTTAMGLLHFARCGVGAVVLEVGMGGRLDSTNVVHPLLSIITSISFDHTRQLGHTLAAIATEKAGIFKRGRPAISGVRDGEAQQAIRRMAARRRCRLLELGGA